MELMNVSEEHKVGFDFSRFRLPHYVEEFQPLLFKEGNSYCAVLGADPKAVFSGVATPRKMPWWTGTIICLKGFGTRTPMILSCNM